MTLARGLPNQGILVRNVGRLRSFVGQVNQPLHRGGEELTLLVSNNVERSAETLMPQQQTCQDFWGGVSKPLHARSIETDKGALKLPILFASWP